MSLCEDCERFDLRRFETDRHMQQGYAYSDVTDRAFRCAFCALLQSCFEPGSKARWIHIELLNQRRKRLSSCSGGTGLAYIRVFLGERYYLNSEPSFPEVSEDFPLGQEALLRVFANEGSPAAEDSRFAVRKLDREDRYHGLNDWLAECLEHDGCQMMIPNGEAVDSNTNASQLPTRCLNVGTNDEPALFLEETASNTGGYITLSHRWTDSTSACSTTTSNYLQRLISLDTDLLPRTFQEAIEATRYLQIRHLWIDSLCIIQRGDNGVDWRTEAEKMADYYQNSFLTLSAINSERLLPLHPPLHTKYIVQLPFRRHDRPEGHFSVFKLDALSETYQRAVQDSELLTRAWVFQEYLLSRRIVHFTPSMAIFDCQTAGAVSQFSEIMEEFGRDGRPKFPSGTNKQFFKIDKASTSFYYWYEGAGAYSALRLTYPDKDRVIALYGAIAAFRRIKATDAPGPKTAKKSSKVYEHDLQCVEGIWMDHAHVGLMWEKADSGTSDRLASHPSWSWTSIYTSVLWNSPNLDPSTPAYSSLKASHSNLLGNAPAEIHLKSKVQAVSIDRSLKAWEVEHLFEEKIRPRVIDDHYRAVRITHKDRRLCGWASIDYDDSGVVSHDVSIMDDEEDNSPPRPQRCNPTIIPFASAEIYALHISTLKGLDRALTLGYCFTRASAFYVLLIRNKYANVYERVGMGCLFGIEVEQGFKNSPPQEVVLI